MTIAPWDAKRYQKALEEIRDIASGSTTANSLPHIARLAEAALSQSEPHDNRHKFVPNPKYPWFCKICAYAPHEPLMHLPEASA